MYSFSYPIPYYVNGNTSKAKNNTIIYFYCPLLLVFCEQYTGADVDLGLGVII